MCMDMSKQCKHRSEHYRIDLMDRFELIIYKLIRQECIQLDIEQHMQHLF
jgi:hypothetical protein